MYGQYTVPNAKEFMSLGVGQPAPYILESANQFISYPIDDFNVLQYGMKNGFEDYRKMVCQLMNTFITDSSFTPEYDNIYMTNGITQSIFMLGSLLKKYRYKTVYVEDLTYFIIINIFKDLGFEIKSFNSNNIEGLRKNLQKEAEPCLIYLIPFCNNPTGRSLSCHELNKIIGIVQDFDVMILSDETYQFLHYSNYNSKPNRINSKPLATYSNKIISLGTFSKILVPGIRLGWIYSQKDVLINGNITNIYQWLDNTGFMDSGGSVNPTMAYMIEKNITSKFEEYKKFLSGVIMNLEKKSNLIIGVLNKYPEYFEPIVPDGGYFVFVKSKKINSLQLLELAKDCGFNFHSGNKFTILDNQTDTFRLSVSYYSLTDFENYYESRIDNLVKSIDEYINKYHINISLHGIGKLGKLIQSELENTGVKYNIITRQFDLRKLIQSEFENTDINYIIATREFDLRHINTSNYKNKIIIDVSSSEGTIELINECYNKNIFPKLIIGTTGHTEKQINEIKTYSKFASVFYCSNFSKGIQNLINIIEGLTFIPNSINIIDIHHIEKKDAPSGTAKLLKTHLKKKFPEIEINIESERIGNEVGTHIIKFNIGEEIIELTHKALNRNIFASGCVGLIEKISVSTTGFFSQNF